MLRGATSQSPPVSQFPRGFCANFRDPLSLLFWSLELANIHPNHMAVLQFAVMIYFMERPYNRRPTLTVVVLL